VGILLVFIVFPRHLGLSRLVAHRRLIEEAGPTVHANMMLDVKRILKAKQQEWKKIKEWAEQQTLKWVSGEQRWAARAAEALSCPCCC
jgi:hypothetical protein